MDDLFFWFIVIAGLSIVGSIAWWALVAFGLFKAAKLANAQFEQQLQQAMALARQLQTLPPQQRPAANAELSAALLNLNAKLSQIDQVHRGKHEAHMGELMGMAASAGIDWRP